MFVAGARVMRIALQKDYSVSCLDLIFKIRRRKNIESFALLGIGIDRRKFVNFRNFIFHNKTKGGPVRVAYDL